MVRHHRESVVFTLVVTLLAFLGAALMGLVIALSGAPDTLLLATFLAFLPVGPLLACFLWLDRYEPEPRVLLASGLAWGAFVATAAAIVLQGIGGLFTGVDGVTEIAVVAPVVEEATKGAFLVMLLWWRRAELDGMLDGIVYAGMVGIGFAFVENILYLAAAYDGTDGLGPGGSGALTMTFVIRCLVSPFAHPLFTAFFGIGVGIAVNSRTPSGRFAALATGYALAVLTHAMWNGAALGLGGNFVVVYLTLMAPLFLAFVGFAVWLRRSERTMLTRSLTDAAHRGLLPATDIAWLVDLGARRAARRFAKERGGDAGERAMEEYQQAAVELGFLHHRYLRGTPPPDFAARGQVFVERLHTVRPYISFPGQVVPTR
ncbi:PrsW family intramembrane metalloprotease [Nocardioides sp. Y6]|uniref:PrsW family intramembrane metalloprotease n=1 Tax=Nocardioides malaquae TaxID=2773426 RepID=A0ABR9RUH9_9ACTN|nr:PrsW family intramembrane metalloprotease [Nocardioides malaquae]MBE7325158.1 PrsW family intramembrane metalloprotease [Nocardioides malaquae]